MQRSKRTLRPVTVCLPLYRGVHTLDAGKELQPLEALSLVEKTSLVAGVSPPADPATTLQWASLSKAARPVRPAAV